VEGLDHMSKKKIIHRDLKPQSTSAKNLTFSQSDILLSSPDPEKCLVKICGKNSPYCSQKLDFGFSRYYTDNELMTSRCSSPLYAAWSVISQQPYDSTCDIWSLGSILFELFTGEPLFTVNLFSPF
jgi:serine/threonine protein kinase